MMEIELTLNGKKIQAAVSADMLLIDFVRAQGCFSVKRGCETANCGLCTVLMDDVPVLSCSVLAARAAGHKIQTLEGLQEEAEEFVKKIGVLPGIKIRGFMTSAPFVENPEDNRKYFRELKQLLVDINNKNIDNVYMNVLSMGMTNDYTVAVEEGATHVRVGTAIFGARDYSH